MTSYAAFIRGINLAGHNRLTMSALRECFAALGLAEVTTYLQSGNVLFRSQSAPRPEALEAALLDRFGLALPVAVRTSDELAALHAAQPFADAEEATLHVAFLVGAAPPQSGSLTGIERYAPERAVLLGREVYLSLPHGVAHAKLPAALARQLPVPMTMRNWRTVTALVTRLGGSVSR